MGNWRSAFIKGYWYVSRGINLKYQDIQCRYLSSSKKWDLGCIFLIWRTSRLPSSFESVFFSLETYTLAYSL
jgi:hypothetical protein